uniref:NADH dehydrogenase subunit 4L n=1 Tax=Schistosoma haematobium TaxID=6185 RepID=Q1I0P1_SCHHA|nr:NADH dehydrogenase subunit 4L [Schistosoma haematobium]AAZ57310.1 NADH dehydrogenase subunit 4L [Schistosoma haematobium]QDO72030.1 NADH dehydrogenase subunit 4L [Schistosoma haematobium]QDO72138.1 NADH dehydrogenase subunit 4L [Schistosoma haematobium]QDO72150.1 NADH dehydrogenase subunit 4L [Schistosoma haematobium]QRW36470.1 NADH dehydrogenase subunit 4L [Schistosoma haematobium]
MISILILGVGLLLIGLFLCNYSLFNYLIILENYNVIVLLISLSILESGCRMMFICMMSMFVVEASLMLMTIGVSIKSGCIRIPLGL